MQIQASAQHLTKFWEKIANNQLPWDMSPGQLDSICMQEASKLLLVLV